MTDETKKLRIAAIADIHMRETDKGKWAESLKELSKQADLLLIGGDLTDTGDEAEAKILGEELKVCSIPVIAVLGNHDYEKGRHKLIRQTLQNDRVHILDGETFVMDGVGIAGVKGFGGGFDHYMLSMFGEEAMKAFVQEGVHEALSLDRALARLDKEHGDIKKIALMHYAPIADTVKGEPEALFPFLGCSRLAEPLSRRHVIAAFHGHAHLGSFQGEAAGGVKVFNVAAHVLANAGYSKPFFIYEV